MIMRHSESGSSRFTSSDLALVTAVSLFFPILSIDKTNPHKALFWFNRVEGLDDVVERFWKRELLIEPRQYFDQLKSIKARLYGNE